MLRAADELKDVMDNPDSRKGRYETQLKNFKELREKLETYRDALQIQAQDIEAELVSAVASATSRLASF